MGEGISCQCFGSLLEVIFSSRSLCEFSLLEVDLHYPAALFSRLLWDLNVSSVSCAGCFCLWAWPIVAVERMVVCLKSFPLLLYSEPSCPSAMSDGKISAPGHYQMRGIQTSCGQLPSRGTMKYLFSGWEGRDSSSSLCQLEKHTKLLQFKFCVFSFVTNLLSTARKKLPREFIYMTVSFRLSNKSFEPVNIFVYGH